MPLTKLHAQKSKVSTLGRFEEYSTLLGTPCLTRPLSTSLTEFTFLILVKASGHLLSRELRRRTRRPLGHSPHHSTPRSPLGRHRKASGPVPPSVAAFVAFAAVGSGASDLLATFELASRETVVV